MQDEMGLEEMGQGGRRSGSEDLRADVRKHDRGVAFVLSIMTSLAGLPEVEGTTEKQE